MNYTTFSYSSDWATAGATWYGSANGAGTDGTKTLCSFAHLILLLLSVFLPSNYYFFFKLKG
jgi:hypothetical protein